MLEISAEHIQIGFANHTANFHSVAVVRGVLAIAAALDPAAPREEVVRRVASDELAPAFAYYLLDLLQNSDCLVADGGITPPAGQEALARFLGSVGLDAGATLARLAASRVVVVTPNSSAHELSAALTGAALSPSVVSIEPGTTEGVALAQIAAQLDGREVFLASWNFPYRLPFARSINDFAIERGLPVLFGGTEGALGRIGPYVLPGNTACLECLNRRLLSHAGADEMSANVAYRRRDEDRVSAPWPVHPVFHDALVRLFSLEVALIARMVPSRTVGGVIDYSYADGVVERHPVYRAPRCSSCRSVSPERLAWDARFPAPVVKDQGQ